MSDAVQTPAEPQEGAAFAAAAVEGPFGFKPDRNRPIEPHFEGFGRLTPDQARQVLDVREGRRPQCLLQLTTESVLVEHCGQGYRDPATGRQWGYRVRRLGHAGPPPEPVAPPPPPPPVDREPPLVEEPTPLPESPPAEVPPWVPPEPIAEPPPIEPEPAAAEPADDWAAPARSPRAAALSDPAERAALVRVLLLWFVVALLLADCVAVLVAGR